MLFTTDNYEDISRYYKHTYVKFKETGDRLFFINRVNNEKVSGSSSDGTPFELLLRNDAPYEVDYVLPHKSYFQYGNYACLLQRIPAKQYQRGVSPNNVAVSALRAAGSLAGQELSFSILEAFVSKQTFVSLTQAIGEVEKMSVVLSPRFAYTPSNRRIYADTLCVGQIQPKHSLLNCFHKLFKPELERLAQGSKYKVV